MKERGRRLPDTSPSVVSDLARTRFWDIEYFAPFEAKLKECGLHTPGDLKSIGSLQDIRAYLGMEADALGATARRFRFAGVGPVDLHRYGTPEDHDKLHGLDVEGLRAFLTSTATPSPLAPAAAR